MNRRDFTRLATSATVLAAGARGAIAATPSAGLEQTTLICAAATAFLAALDPGQRQAAQFPFAPQAKATAARFTGGRDGRMLFVGEQYGRAIWSNFPVSDVPRPGVRLGALSFGQTTALMVLLRALLSPQGFRKVLETMGSDEALAKTGTPFTAGIAAYTVGIFGEPGFAKPWMVQFGGHHLGLNIVVADGRGVLAPLHTGAMPAIYTGDRGPVRVLAAENDKAFALVRSLSGPQRRQAVIDHDVSTLAFGPGHDGEAIAPVGLGGGDMSGVQRRLLLDLVFEWVGVIAEAYGAPRMAEIKAGLLDTAFAWSGPTTHRAACNGASYFRIVGPTLAIEFAPQKVGGDPTLHVHTIYRDLSNSYGRGFA